MKKTKTTAPTPAALDRLYSDRELNEHFGFPLPMLRKNRQLRRGIPFIRLGRLARYRATDVRAYVDSRVVPTRGR